MPQDKSSVSLESRWYQRWRAIRWPLLLLVIIGLLPGFYFFESVRVRAAWHDYERDATQRGVKLKFTSYIPPAVPDAENFASIPIFDATFRGSEGSGKYVGLFSYLKGSPVTAAPPKLANSVKQQTIDLEAWRDYFVAAKFLETSADNVAADVLRAMDGFAEPLAQFREAAGRPHCRFPVRWEKQAVAPLPHLAILNDLERLYAVRSAAHLAMGDSSAAYEDFHDGLRLVTATRAEPTLILGMVRISMAMTIMRAVRGGLADGAWSDSDLRRIDEALAGLDWLADYHFAMSSERAYDNHLFDSAVANPKMMYGFGGSRQFDPYRVYPSAWLYQSKLRLNHCVDEMLGRIDPVQKRWFSDRPIPSSPANIRSSLDQPRYVLFEFLAEFFEAVDKRYVHTATITELARIAIALERYRLVHGRFPEQLDELVPKFMSKLPLEIVNGEPYRYQRTEGGRFLLYSVGADLRDDGGVTDDNLSASKQPDWVWPER